MKKRIPSLALAFLLGIGGIAGGAVLAPAVASAATSDTTVAEAAGDRVAQTREALAGLVTDGTITEDQADQVASALAESLPRGGHGHGAGGPGMSLDPAAEALGLPADEVRTQLEGGASLASIAEAQGVPRDALVSALLEAAQARLDQAVQDGRITQEEADERAADLPERVATQVDREGLPARGERPGRRGHLPGGSTDGLTGSTTEVPTESDASAAAAAGSVTTA